MVFNDADFQLRPDLKMDDIAEWDSFNHINLMIAIESEFGIEFDSDELGKLTSVADIGAAVQNRLASAGQ